MGDGVFGGDGVAAVLGDGVVEQLRRVGIELVVVFRGDLGGEIMEGFAGFCVEICPGDFDLLADVRGGDTPGEFVSCLVKVLGDLAMACFMFDEVLRRVDGQPDDDLELQRHPHVGDSEDCVRGIRFASVAADDGAGHKVGIACRRFVRSKGRHAWRWSGRVKRAGSENDGEFVDGHLRSIEGLLRRGGRPEDTPSRNENEEQKDRDEQATQGRKPPQSILGTRWPRMTALCVGDDAKDNAGMAFWAGRPCFGG